ncbi:MAG: Gfo/Idh/MocA family oxidoreductase [Chloroflexota bacterium]|nr:Gfo/Idh/MocA family oxidoreductase [Chloroflexota bacterium]
MVAQGAPAISATSAATGRPLRVAILGAGTIAAVHAANLDQLPEARLVAVADTDTSRAAALAAPRGAHVLAGLDDLLDGDLLDGDVLNGEPPEGQRRGRKLPNGAPPGAQTLDAVLVCLPPFATPGVVAQIAARGLHVYAEKPVALTLPDALADLDAVRRAGVVAASGYMWRASPIVVRAREILAGRRVGLVQGTVITGPPPPAWWRHKASSGGVLVELATHVVDLVRLFAGEADRVTCVGAQTLLEEEPGWGLGSIPGPIIEDVVAAAITFRSGAVGGIGATCATTGGRWGLDVVARNLHLSLDFFPERLTGNVDGEPILYQPPPPPDIVPHGFSGSASWYLSLRHFLSAVASRAPGDVAAPYEEGVRTLALTLACERSLAGGGAPADVPPVL